MKTFKSKSLIGFDYVAFFKGMTLFFLGASVVVLAVNALSIDPRMFDAISYFQSVVWTDNGTQFGKKGAEINAVGNSYILGNVGIGKNNPSAKLDVEGDMSVNGNIKSDSLNVSGNVNLNGMVSVVGKNVNMKGGDIYKYTGGNVIIVGGESFTYSQATEDCILGSYPCLGGDVFVYGGYGASNKGNVILAHDGSSSVGKVGIGTSSPSEILSVNGNMDLIGNVLMSGMIKGKTNSNIGNNVSIVGGNSIPPTDLSDCMIFPTPSNCLGGDIFLYGGYSWRSGNVVLAHNGNDSIGKVSVGKNNATTTLDVEGSLGVSSGNQYKLIVNKYGVYITGGSHNLDGLGDYPIFTVASEEVLNNKNFILMQGGDAFLPRGYIDTSEGYYVNGSGGLTITFDVYDSFGVACYMTFKGGILVETDCDNDM